MWRVIRRRTIFPLRISREKNVLLKAQDAARDVMLDPQSIDAFVQTQMAVSKTSSTVISIAGVCSLKSVAARPLAEVRAQILQLDNTILNLISRQIMTGGGFGEEQDRQLSGLLNDKQISALEKAQLIDALGEIKRR